MQVLSFLKFKSQYVETHIFSFKAPSFLCAPVDDTWYGDALHLMCIIYEL